MINQYEIKEIPRRKSIVHPLWPENADIHFHNYRRIHPLQQKKVEEIIKTLSGNPEVEKIIIFGSSVRRDCHTGSDVDVYVVLKPGFDKKINLGNVQFRYDLWTNHNVDERMLNEINHKGVTVYEHSA